jgi:surface antigen
MYQSIKWLSIFMVAALVGCSNTDLSSLYSTNAQSLANGSKNGAVGTALDRDGQEKKVKVTMSGGGEVGLRSMDANDKAKMSKALDAAPGKATSWVNAGSGIEYTVTPLKKMTVDNNPFCREYQVLAAKGSYQRTITEKACVMSDGNWHTI